MKDIFRPRTDPARTLYDAFRREAENRVGKTPGEWMQAEEQVMWSTSRDYAQQHGLTEPTMAEVLKSQRQAMGHVDYGAKWAYAVAEILNKVP